MISEETNEEKMENVEVEFDDSTFMRIALMAHEEDITFNQMCNKILKEHIESEEKKEEKSP